MKIVIDGKELTIPSSGTFVSTAPVGTILSYMGTSAPKDYLICDGSVLQITKYQSLANHFKNEFGLVNYFGGDGETTFAVPDLRNMFLRGYHGEAEEQLSGEVGERQEVTYFPNTYGQRATRGVYLGVTNFEGFIDGFEKASPKNPDYEKHASTFYQGVTPDSSNIIQYTDDDIMVEYTSRPLNVAVLYIIKAVESGTSTSEVYTEEEQVIGTWFGKPLYQKTIMLDFDVPQSQKMVRGSIKLEDTTDKVVVCGEGSLQCITDATRRYVVPFFDKPHSTTTDTIEYSIFEYFPTLSLVYITNQVGRHTGWITLKYYKTSD